MLVVAARCAGVRHLLEAREGQCHHEGADGVGNGEANVAEQRAVEVAHSPRMIRVMRCGHFLEYEGMAAHGALTKDDQVARQQVGAFHGDGNGNRLVCASQIVVGSEHDALATLNVHRIVANASAQLGDVGLEDAGGHSGPRALIDGRRRDAACRIHDVAVAHHAGDHKLHAFEAAYR